MKKKARIYYGPPTRERKMYWTVSVTDAKRTVIVNGTVSSAINAHPGVTVGCALSDTVRENADKFGHAAYLASASKTVILVVDRLHTDGSPMHAVRYAHSYGKIIDCNDDGTLKKMVKKDPSVMDREFILRPPRQRPSVTGTHDRGNPKARTRSLHSVVPRGALLRAVRAGRIGEHVAEQLQRAFK